MSHYPSFDERMDNPERQSCINLPQPLVKGDPVAVVLVCACALGSVALFVLAVLR